MMEVAFLLLVSGGFWVGTLKSRRNLGIRRLQAWQDAVAACGLQVVETSSGWTPRLQARAGAMEVWIRNAGQDNQATRIEVLVSGPPDLRQVRILPESLWRRPIEIEGKSFVHWAREIEIGDESFDREFFLEGPPRLVLALLDAATRQLLVRVKAEGSLEVSFGMLRSTVSDKSLPDVLVLLLNIGHRFGQVGVPRRLAENAYRDPEPGVRLQNLLMLIRELPGEPETVEALRVACSDPSPEIRLRAAKEIGAEGRGVLLELAEDMDDDEVSAEAVSALDRELPFGRVNTILDRALSRRRLRTVRACLEALGNSGDAAIEVLANVLEQDHGELAPVAARALGATGSPAAELPLIQALERNQTDLRVAAAEALGRVGSAAAVLPLKEAADGFFPGEVRRAARQAIAEIQSRVQGASPGQLSLAPADTGQLSLAQEGGKLSLAEDPAGRLSLPSGKDPA
jgi:HEAT repeat protein